MVPQNAQPINSGLGIIGKIAQTFQNKKRSEDLFAWEQMTVLQRCGFGKNLPTNKNPWSEKSQVINKKLRFKTICNFILELPIRIFRVAKSKTSH